jgi:hypothetical protein
MRTKTAWSEEKLIDDAREIAAWTTLGVVSAVLLSGVYGVWVVLRWSVGR